jgi:hypothetical protein
MGAVVFFHSHSSLCSYSFSLPLFFHTCPTRTSPHVSIHPRHRSSESHLRHRRKVFLPQIYLFEAHAAQFDARWRCFAKLIILKREMGCVNVSSLDICERIEESAMITRSISNKHTTQFILVSVIRRVTTLRTF